MDTVAETEVNLWTDDPDPPPKPSPTPPPCSRMMVNPISLEWFIDELYEQEGYYRLTPRVWAWIRDRVANAYDAFAAHKLDFDDWLEIEDRVYPIRKWAMGHLNVDEVMEAIKANEELPTWQGETVPL